jgi:hypothetical protein
MDSKHEKFKVKLEKLVLQVGGIKIQMPLSYGGK